jgi:hypothetical protein
MSEEDIQGWNRFITKSFRQDDKYGFPVFEKFGKYELIELVRYDKPKNNKTILFKKNENKCIEIVKNLENPYPKDIFTWDNPSKLDFNRGRFHQFCFELVENIRRKLLEEMDNENFEAR